MKHLFESIQNEDGSIFERECKIWETENKLTVMLYGSQGEKGKYEISKLSNNEIHIETDTSLFMRKDSPVYRLLLSIASKHMRN